MLRVVWAFLWPARVWAVLTSTARATMAVVLSVRSDWNLRPGTPARLQAGIQCRWRQLV
nr:hypothetical protein [Acidiferrimicrobium sp. IK]